MRKNCGMTCRMFEAQVEAGKTVRENSYRIQAPAPPVDPQAGGGLMPLP